MSENKRHKQHETERTDEMIDYISNLPDCILHLILSFLSTLEVVLTSILSKRWKNLWATIPSLDFDDFLLNASDADCRHWNSFMNFEERIFRSRETPQIEKFRLSFHEGVKPEVSSSWISNAVMHNVQELYLWLFINNASAISQSIFNCKSLVILEIELYADIEIPSHIYLPSLKILNIYLVWFMNAQLTEKLFSCSPVLEELGLWDCALPRLKNITISSSTLKKLTIKDRVDYVSTHPNGCKIKIDAKNLTHLEYKGCLLHDQFILNNVPSLVKACIDISLLYWRQKEAAYFAVDLLKRLKNVVFLSVSSCTLESLMCADSKLNPFPFFPNLTHLVLTTEIENHTFETFMDLLKFCPVLQSISLYEGFNSCMLLSETDSVLLSVPKCISCHLKTLSLKNFHAYDSELRFLKFVLNNACVLEKMDVWWCKSELLDQKKQRDVRKEFGIAEKSSASCIINLS